MGKKLLRFRVCRQIIIFLGTYSYLNVLRLIYIYHWKMLKIEKNEGLDK